MNCPKYHEYVEPNYYIKHIFVVNRFYKKINIISICNENDTIIHNIFSE